MKELSTEYTSDVNKLSYIITYNAYQIDMCEACNIFNLSEDLRLIGLRENKTENLEDLLEVFRHFIYKNDATICTIPIRYDSKKAKEITKLNIKFLNSITNKFKFLIKANNENFLTIKIKKS